MRKYLFLISIFVLVLDRVTKIAVKEASAVNAGDLLCIVE